MVQGLLVQIIFSEHNIDEIAHFAVESRVDNSISNLDKGQHGAGYRYV